jgi:hypothetical protein
MVYAKGKYHVERYLREVMIAKLAPRFPAALFL